MVSLPIEIAPSINASIKFCVPTGTALIVADAILAKRSIIPTTKIKCATTIAVPCPVMTPKKVHTPSIYPSCVTKYLGDYNLERLCFSLYYL